MIVRIWHGYTTKENADAYAQLVTSKIFREIEIKSGDGFHGAQLLKREMAEEVEFTTIIWFRNLEAIKELTGEDYETAYIPKETRNFLSQFDSKVTHSHLLYSSVE
ncbi:hypothetical protein [Salinimicrobium sp. TH3]|uniref:hypothetical protein n=1 Tax=Salinimicrobium sp. TH3 TaxID=2997342 RepID=UPI0022742EA4|nr:hypothetical protein [Salinimicrobium sp. TH3]MCY2686563.1 hypothetical protein [Salinimicrobium sp. TH3]